jgi:hypothetical protein
MTQPRIVEQQFAAAVLVIFMVAVGALLRWLEL